MTFVPLQKLAIFGTGIAAIVSLLLISFVLQREKPLRKARLFLKFNALHIIHKGAVSVFIAGILLNLFYVTLLFPQLFDPYYFFGLGAAIVVLHLGFTGLVLSVLWIVRKEKGA